MLEWNLKNVILIKQIQLLDLISALVNKVAVNMLT